MRRPILALVMAASVLAGCGQPSIPRRVAGGLQDRVATIRDDAEAGRTFAARREIEALTGRVRSLVDRGVIAEDVGLEILDAASGVADALDLAPSPSATVTETSPSPSPEEEHEEEGGGHGNGNGNGNGNGGGHDD